MPSSKLLLCLWVFNVFVLLHGVIMRLVYAAVSIILWLPSIQQEQRGTDQSPLVVKISPTPKSAEETTEEAEDRKEKTSTDTNLVNATWVLAGIGVLQLIVFGAQAVMLKKTVDSSTEESKAMERHIGEATRSANAMENIASVIHKGNKAVTRAYLTVIVNRAVFQQKGGPGQIDFKWQGVPKVLNTGLTTARKVKIRISADILPNPVPADFNFPLSEPSSQEADQTIGAHQGAELMGGFANKVVPENEVAAIKEGNGRSLCVWGIIKYEDIFGDAHTTKFGQQLFWWPDNNVHGLYIPGQNDAD